MRIRDSFFYPVSTIFSIEDFKFRILQESTRLGLLAVGFSPACFLEKEAKQLENWLSKKAHGKMAYMENYFDMRTDPRKIVDNAHTIISVLYNYYPSKSLHDENTKLKISRYAYGIDYHYVLKDKLNLLYQFIQTEGYPFWGEISGRAFVDSAPVAEKALAKRAGLGWIGKNTTLLRKKVGSYFFIGELILDINLFEDTKSDQQYRINKTDAETFDFCGSCHRCIDACPTQALTPYQLDASRCISYLTIELKDEIPEELAPLLSGWVFGCDICQEVCPWNRFSIPHQEPAFAPLEFIEHLSPQFWKELTSSQYRKKTVSSPLSRIKLDKWLQNLNKAEKSITDIYAQNH